MPQQIIPGGDQFSLIFIKIKNIIKTNQTSQHFIIKSLCLCWSTIIIPFGTETTHFTQADHTKVRLNKTCEKETNYCYLYLYFTFVRIILSTVFLKVKVAIRRVFVVRQFECDFRRNQYI